MRHMYKLGILMFLLLAGASIASARWYGVRGGPWWWEPYPTYSRYVFCSDCHSRSFDDPFYDAEYCPEFVFRVDYWGYYYWPVGAPWHSYRYHYNPYYVRYYYPEIGRHGSRWVNPSGHDYEHDEYRFKAAFEAGDVRQHSSDYDGLKDYRVKGHAVQPMNFTRSRVEEWHGGVTPDRARNEGGPNGWQGSPQNRGDQRNKPSTPNTKPSQPSDGSRGWQGDKPSTPTMQPSQPSVEPRGWQRDKPSGSTPAPRESPSQKPARRSDNSGWQGSSLDDPPDDGSYLTTPTVAQRTPRSYNGDYDYGYQRERQPSPREYEQISPTTTYFDAIEQRNAEIQLGWLPDSQSSRKPRTEPTVKPDPASERHGAYPSTPATGTIRGTAGGERSSGGSGDSGHSSGSSGRGSSGSSSGWQGRK